MTLVRLFAIACMAAWAACAADQTPATSAGAGAQPGAGTDQAATGKDQGTGEGAGPATSADTAVDPAMSTDEGLVALLRDLGMGDVQALEPGAIRFRLEGQLLALFRDDDHDLQLYYGVGGVRCPLETINEWNKEHRFSRAYADDQGDMVLESDLISDGGVLRAQVEAFINTFRISVIAFSQHMIANCQTTP